MSTNEEATGICAELIRRRLVPKDELYELGADMALREEVSRRLAEVGLLLLDRPGIPFFGVAMAALYRETERVSDHGLDSRALGLLLHFWLRLVAPYLYEGQLLPNDIEEVTVSLDSMREELPGDWRESTLGMYTTRLANLNWVKKIRGENKVSAGPMLWLAVEHDQLMELLRREKGLYKAVERFIREQRGQEDEG
jgi:hypothetical protein